MDYSRKISERLWNMPDKGELESRREKTERIIVTVRNENIPSWKVIEKAEYILNTKRMYKDLNDDKEELYRFYEMNVHRLRDISSLR